MASETAIPTDQSTATQANNIRKPEEAVTDDINEALEAVATDTVEDATAVDVATTQAVGESDSVNSTGGTVHPVDDSTSEPLAGDEAADLESIGESSESSEEEQAESDGDTEAAGETQASPAKPSVAAKIVGGAKRNVKSIGACVGSLLTGAAVMFVASGSKPEPVVEKVEEAPVFSASLVRRSEPISPLIPFEGLQPEVVLLGEKLFHDPALSRNGKIACASCHEIEKGGADGRAVPVGFDDKPGMLNTPSVLTAALNHTQFWDGRADSLEEQVDSPIKNPIEMNSDWPRVLKFLRNNRRYNDAFVAHMGGEPTEALVRTALATYQRALLPVGSPFDQWLQGDESALSSDAYAGYHLFKKMNCINCHNGENVGGHIYQPLGKVKDYFTSIRPATERDYGRFNVTQNPEDKFVFRVPSLRNVELTAPYLHDGSVPTLRDAVEIMIEYQVGLEANPEDVRRIVLFLESLTAKAPAMPKPAPLADANVQ